MTFSGRLIGEAMLVASRIGRQLLPFIPEEADDERSQMVRWNSMRKPIVAMLCQFHEDGEIHEDENGELPPLITFKPRLGIPWETAVGRGLLRDAVAQAREHAVGEASIRATYDGIEISGIPGEESILILYEAFAEVGLIEYVRAYLHQEIERVRANFEGDEAERELRTYLLRIHKMN